MPACSGTVARHGLERWPGMLRNPHGAREVDRGSHDDPAPGAVQRQQCRRYSARVLLAWARADARVATRRRRAGASIARATRARARCAARSRHRRSIASSSAATRITGLRASTAPPSRTPDQSRRRAAAVPLQARRRLNLPTRVSSVRNPRKHGDYRTLTDLRSLGERQEARRDQELSLFTNSGIAQRRTAARPGA